MRSIVKTGKGLLLVVVAGMVAEWPLYRCLARMDIAFQHDFRAGGNLQVMGQAFDDLGLRAAQQPGELVLA